MPNFICQVCSMSVSVDTDTRVGKFSGTFYWGPNYVPETNRHGRPAGIGEGPADTNRGIKEYRLYWTSPSGVRIGDRVATIAAQPGNDQACCDGDKYQFTLLSTVLPVVQQGPLYMTVVPVEEIISTELEMIAGQRVQIIDVEPPTTTTTETSITATTTTYPAELSTIVIGGSMAMPVSDPTLVDDPDFKSGVQKGIATTCGLPPEKKDLVVVTLTYVAGRRLSSGSARRLAGKVDVDFTVTIEPKDAGTVDTTAVKKNLADAAEDTSTLTANMQAALDETLPESKKFTVTVSEMAPPTVQLITHTSSTTTKTTTTTTATTKTVTTTITTTALVKKRAAGLATRRATYGAPLAIAAAVALTLGLAL